MNTTAVTIVDLLTRLVELSEAGAITVEIRVRHTRGPGVVKAVKPPTPIEERTPAKNRALVIETLKRNPDGVPKKTLTDMMKGRNEAKFAVLAELALSNITVEYGRPLHVRLK